MHAVNVPLIRGGVLAVAALVLFSHQASAQDQSAGPALTPSQRILSSGSEPNRAFKDGKVMRALRVNRHRAGH
jgi:hypothetical protein